MGNTVFAEGMGFFHKGSGGKGVAPGDVCLSPPPPPTGPAPIPYVNLLSASDLAKGSKSVKVQGNPTALENASEVSTSTGNEAGTQGGGVVTHKTKGKGVFKLWSFVVKVEGKGVDRHGDMMAQNTASDLPNCIDAAAAVNFLQGLTDTQMTKNCAESYESEKHRQETTSAQRKKVQNRACWECSRDLANLQRRTVQSKAVARRIKALQKNIASQQAGKETMVADHQPPENVCWEMGGCNMKPSPQAFKDAMKKLYVKPHCSLHSSRQGNKMKALDNRKIYDFMNNKMGLAL
jgi:uncharacterized Zn-binding protein involved in type VI secretion